MASPEEVIKHCEAAFDNYKDDCNKFVKAVSSNFGVTLYGDANSIVDQIQGGEWIQLKDGKAAADKASNGYLVIGGMKGSEQAEPSEHGHVVIVVKGELEHGKYPKAYWGRLGGQGEKNKGVNWSWRKGDRDRITYGAAATQ